MQDIDRWQKELKTELTKRLNELGKVVKQVRIAADLPPQVVESQKEPSPSEAPEPQIPKWVHPIRVQVGIEVLHLGTIEFNDVAKNISQVAIDFSHMQLTNVYALQKATVAEIKVRETALGKQTKKYEKLNSKMEAKMQKIK